MFYVPASRRSPPNRNPDIHIWCLRAEIVNGTRALLVFCRKAYIFQEVSSGNRVRNVIRATRVSSHARLTSVNRLAEMAVMRKAEKKVSCEMLETSPNHEVTRDPATSFR